MAGHAGPPEGTPLGGGDDDEFRSTVFDESFVNAAHLKEFSARERLDEHERPVADVPQHERDAEETGEAGGASDASGEAPAGRGHQGRRRISGQFVGLLLVIVLAFGAAIYMGASGSQQELPAAAPQIPLRSTVVPLMPRGTVPGADPAELLRQSHAARFETGQSAVTLPSALGTQNFTSRQVRAALVIARQYVIASSMDPEVLAGETGKPVRELLSPGQRSQFDHSLRNPTTDDRFAPTGWMVRFDPEEVELAQPDVRARGTLRVQEADSDALEISAQHVLAYTLRATGEGKDAEASLFTARREVRLRLTHSEIRLGQLTVEKVTLQAGPLPCAEATHDWLRPLLAGEDPGADASAGTDPYATDGSTTALCGVLARSAQPDLDD